MNRERAQTRLSRNIWNSTDVIVRQILSRSISIGSKVNLSLDSNDFQCFSTMIECIIIQQTTLKRLSHFRLLSLSLSLSLSLARQSSPSRRIRFKFTLSSFHFIRCCYYLQLITRVFFSFFF